MPVRISAVLTIALTAVAGLGACGDGGESAVGEDIRIVGTEMEFSPEAVTATPGRHRVVFSNEGAAYHELAVVSPEGTVLGAQSIPSGKTVTFDVELDDPGTYQLVCREPGHTAAGMVGMLTVTG